jgi:hypothetical protein
MESRGTLWYKKRWKSQTKKRFGEWNAPHIPEHEALYKGVKFVNGRKAKDKRANEVPAA